MAPAKVLASRNTVVEVGHNAISQPGPAHLMRAVKRFGERLGKQFGAAITYFLVLAVMPIAMFTFASLGFVLDVVRPDLLPVVVEQIESNIGGNSSLTEQLEEFLTSWQSVGIIAILSALYTGQGFIGNLGAAVRAQLHADFDDVVPDQSFIKKILNNVLTLLGLIIGLLLTVALTIVGTGLGSVISETLNLGGWASSLLRIVPFIITLGAAWLIFMFLFTMLPDHPVGKRAKIRGSLLGAAAFTILLNLATVLVEIFSGNKAAGVFGSIIAIMLTMNIFARIILFVAAWIGTAQPPRPPEDSSPEYRFVEPKVQAQSLGALLAGAGIVALTLLGFRRLDEHQTKRE
ncbi:MAG: YihY/virulence factor BrkB family protein [Brevibacterium sp.]|uniref:YhjD/YihY/BrkB family envelope integrity protein n=1 Tax=Brevibacterium sp. TaxID=1701 RepID=UPI002647240A|nr:YhjD/YihY/BrkB family envelope integrity protein [Brevibacterium sp.]MDN5806758.1 YihY/virulence factor BrkB family protein [Brevibacterium sp.]MDN5832874.1 YihY/virulence factor BrkB family protein [Brevibacterium sp.]MDN5875989.1 YihY/virulence factor BrkB family protein [Brevibacterium sp.]MDN5908415.1 YihY/virulence factor BrkB family protein [Brevibacterium sp.]MDN6135185.1 YihY/virulence factor BrkB family protein [Brevibacterium sp.]